MKIYFAGSIRGGRDDKDLYFQLIKYLNNYGQVLTEHVGNLDLTEKGEENPNDVWIYKRDMSWIKQADVLVAEVTTPSLGVGYEIAKAEAMNKKILCLFRKQGNKKLSAMINGSDNLIIKKYKSYKDAILNIDMFFKSINN